MEAQNNNNIENVDKFFEDLKSFFSPNKGQHVSESRAVDWTQSSCLTEPEDQGNCGCCTAFSHLKLFEWFYCRKTGQKVRFSKQFAVDCGHLSGMNGCISGSAISMLKFVEDYGLKLAEQHPYVGFRQQCPLMADERATTSWAAQVIRPTGIKYSLVEKEYWEEEVAQQPLIAFMQLSEKFFNYAGGVFRNSLKRYSNKYGHFGLIVGHGIQNNRRYWLISNSFGSDWGANGLLRLTMDSDRSGIGYVLKVEVDSFE